METEVKVEILINEQAARKRLSEKYPRYDLMLKGIESLKGKAMYVERANLDAYEVSGIRYEEMKLGVNVLELMTKDSNGKNKVAYRFHTPDKVGVGVSSERIDDPGVSIGLIHPYEYELSFKEPVEVRFTRDRFRDGVLLVIQ